MNRFSNIVLVGALVNLLVLMLFPPFDVVSLTDRGVRFFDALHPAFAVPPNRTVNADILFFAIYGVVGNALAAFVLLSRPTPVAPRHIVLVISLINLVVVLLFPPFEAFPWAGRTTTGSFDGFYFAFGDKSRRSVFLPMLTLELIYVALNACVFWLAMGLRERAPVVEPGAETLLAKSDEFRRQAERKFAARGGEKGESLWVRGPDRRKRKDPSYRGPERRTFGGDRRARA
jgi:hypothetical protein